MGWHAAWQALFAQTFEQHSEPLKQGAPGTRHEGSGKSTPTVAWPFRFMISVTSTGTWLTVASVGSLIHVGTDAGVTWSHAPA
ncbi:MAG: hypothetical protein QM820_22540 [Minicystis sp.]